MTADDDATGFTAAAAGRPAGGEVVLWEGEIADPNTAGQRLRVVHRNGFDEVEFALPDGAWGDWSHGAANAVAGHLARQLAAKDAELLRLCEGAERDRQAGVNAMLELRAELEAAQQALANERYNARWQAGESMKEAVHHVEVVKGQRAELASRTEVVEQLQMALSVTNHNLTAMTAELAAAVDGRRAAVELLRECCTFSCSYYGDSVRTCENTGNDDPCWNCRVCALLASPAGGAT
jgi:hypothetical protein